MEQSFLKFTVDSLSAPYIPFPRFLMEDALAALSHDAKVLYALLLDRTSIPRSMVFSKRTAPSAFTSPWNRRRRSFTAAVSRPPAFSGSWSTAV